MRRTAGALVGVLALVGCAAPGGQSRLDEYSARAEQLHADLLDAISAEVPDAADAVAYTEGDVAFVTVESVVATEGGAAAEAVAAALRDQGWTTEPVVDQGGSYPLAQVHRLPADGAEWVVQVAWSDDAPDVLLVVQSPLTTT